MGEMVGQAPPRRPPMRRAIAEVRACVSSSRRRPWHTNGGSSGYRSSSSKEGRGRTTRAGRIGNNHSFSRHFAPRLREIPAVRISKEIEIPKRVYPFPIVPLYFPEMPIDIHFTQADGPPAMTTRMLHRFHCWIRHRSWIPRGTAKRVLSLVEPPR